MNSKVQERCEIFLENRDKIHKAFILENNMIEIVSAASLAQDGVAVEVDKLKECRKLLTKKEGYFSDMRGNNELIIAAAMTKQEDPEKYVDEVHNVYKIFQKGKIFGSGFRALAAKAIVEAGHYSDAEPIVEKTTAILKAMTKRHPFITDDRDTSLAAILAMTDKSVEEIDNEVEEIFSIIKGKFVLHDNAAHSLSQILAVYDGSPASKSERILTLYEAFKNADVQYGKDYELATLGSLYNVDKNADDLASEIIETAELFKKHSGFKFLDMSNTHRLMFGTMMVASVYSPDYSDVGSASISGTAAIVAAQEAAIMVTVVAASSAAAAASSN